QGRKEDYFSLLYLTKKFKCNVEDIIHQVTFDDSDIGINAYYLDRVGRNLYLYYFRWSEDHNLFKDPLDRLADFGMEQIFENDDQYDDQYDDEGDELIDYLKADLIEHQAVIDRVYIQFVFKGSIDEARNSAGLAERVENLE